MAELTGTPSESKDGSAAPAAGQDLKRDGNIFVAVGYKKEGSSLGNMYSRCAQEMLRRGWRRKKTADGRFHLLFGEADGKGIPFRRITQCFRYDYGITPVVNYYRGAETLGRRVKLVESLRKHAAFAASDATEFLPRSFLFYPGRTADSEREALEGARRDSDVWSVRSCDSSKGEAATLLGDVGAVLDMVEGLSEKAQPVVVQPYAAPLLLEGCKVQLRAYALVTHDYAIHLYREGTVMACSEPFSMDDLRNSRAHECLRGGSDEDDLGFDELDAVLGGGDNFEDTLLPQVKSMVTATLMAMRDYFDGEVTGSTTSGDYKSFSVFSFDLAVSAELKVTLVDVSSTAGVRAGLLPQMAKDIVDVAIEPLFDESSGGASTAREGKGGEPAPNGFDLLLTAEAAAKMADESRSRCVVGGRAV